LKNAAVAVLNTVLSVLRTLSNGLIIKRILLCHVVDKPLNAH